jgi:hypothetical protein
MNHSEQTKKGTANKGRKWVMHSAILVAWIAPLIFFFGLERVLERPFFSGARFDGDYAIAAQVVQAAAGDGVDSFVWPAATTAALQAAAHRLGALVIDYPGDFFAPEQIRGDEEKFYYNLEIAIYVGKCFALLGVLLLLWMTYLLLWRLTAAPWVSLVATVYLSSTLSLLSHASWLRVEVWSLVFLAAGVLAGTQSIRSSLPRAFSFWLFLAGLFFSASVYAKINILPALAFSVLCLGCVVLGKLHKRIAEMPAGTAASDFAFSPPGVVRMDFWRPAWLSAMLCVLLCPWWVLIAGLPGATDEISGYDLAVWQSFSSQRWVLGCVLMGLGVILPLLLVIAAHVFSRRAAGAWFLAAALTSGWVIAGGLAALYLIAAPMSNGMEVWLGHVERMVISLLGNIFSDNPYLSNDAPVSLLMEYWKEAGSVLAHPTLGRMLTFWYSGSEAWNSFGSLTSLMPLGLLAMVGVTILLGRRGGLSRGVISLLLLALAGLGLAVTNEWFSLKRGEGLDIRYFLYTTWYLIAGAVFLTVAMREVLVTLFPRRRIWVTGSGMVFGVLLMAASVGSTIMSPMNLSDQLAKFGRQISTTIVNAPRLFRDAGIAGDSSEWRVGSSWSPLLLGSAIQEYEKKMAEAGDRRVFHFSLLPGEVQAYRVQADKSWTEEDGLLWLEVPLPLNGIGGRRTGFREVQMSVELDRGDSMVFGQPHAGLLLRPVGNPGASASQFWSFPSSSWLISPGAVEFAAEVGLDPRVDDVQFVLMWKPRFAEDSFFLFNPQIGWSSWKERRARWFSR